MRRMLIGVALVAIGACSKHEEAPQQNAASSTPVPVTVATARADTLRETISGVGTIAPDAASDWTVYAGEAARIAELPKNEGDAVAVGDVLVQLDIPAITQDLNLKQSALTDATTRLNTAQAAHTKAADMLEKGVIPRSKLEEAAQELGSANSAVAQARALLAIANDALDRTRIKAKFAGTVVKRWHIPGDYVSPGVADPILRVVDSTNVQVVMPLSAAQLERVAPGQAATISLPAPTRQTQVSSRFAPSRRIHTPQRPTFDCRS